MVDYNAVHSNPARVRSINDERVGIDTSLTYQLGAVDTVYFGYTSGFQNVIPGIEGTPMSRTDAPSTVVGRQVFTKVSHLIHR